MRKQPLTWPARALLALLALVGGVALLLLGWAALPQGDVAYLLLAANGSAWRGVAIVTAIGLAAWLGGARVLGRRRRRWSRVLVGLAMVVALSGGVAAWQWGAGIERADVEFISDGATLRGSLLLPPGEGPFPTVVIVHGSPRLAREFYAVWGRRLVRRGIAVLVYDKRGTGRSGGEVPDDNGTPEYLQQLGADAAQAVAAMQRQPNVDASRIGLLGISQGGWTVPVAATRAPQAWRIALLSGPVARVAEENAFSDAAEGYGGDAAEDALAIARGEAAVARAPVGGFDPQPILARLPQPGLWLFGGRDRSVPVATSVRRLDALAAAGRPVRHVVLPDADHLLLDRRAFPPRFDPRVFAQLQAWFAAPAPEPARTR